MTKTGHSAPGGSEKMQLTQQKYREVVQTPGLTVGEGGNYRSERAGQSVARIPLLQEGRVEVIWVSRR